jgi:hypothetical protein
MCRILKPNMTYGSPSPKPSLQTEWRRKHGTPSVLYLESQSALRYLQCMRIVWYWKFLKVDKLHGRLHSWQVVCSVCVPIMSGWCAERRERTIPCVQLCVSLRWKLTSKMWWFMEQWLGHWQAGCVTNCYPLNGSFGTGVLSGADVEISDAIISIREGTLTVCSLWTHDAAADLHVEFQRTEKN